MSEGVRKKKLYWRVAVVVYIYDSPAGERREAPFSRKMDACVFSWKRGTTSKWFFFKLLFPFLPSYLFSFLLKKVSLASLILGTFYTLSLFYFNFFFFTFFFTVEFRWASDHSSVFANVSNCLVFHPYTPNSQ